MFFYEALKKEHILAVNKVKEMSFQDLVAGMPLTPMDSLIGAYRVAKLKKNWPFNDGVQPDSSRIDSEEGKLAYGIVFGHILWPEAMRDLYSYYVSNNRLTEAGTVMEAMVLEHPTEASFYHRTGEVYGKLNDLESASFYFKKAFGLSPSFDDARTLFVIYLKLDKPRDAMPYLDYAIRNNISNLNLLPVKKFTEEIIQLQKAYISDSSNVNVLNLIAKDYLNMGNEEGASIYIAKILKEDPANKEALVLLKQIKKG